MPAAKKSANKNTKKRFSIKSWSRRKQVSIFVLLFAIIGGGVLVFNSFAATLIATANPGDFFQLWKTAVLTTDTNGKSTISVWRMVNSGSDIATHNQYTVPAYTTYQKCAVMKGVGAVVLDSITNVKTGLTNNTAYQGYCSPNIYSGNYAINTPMEITVSSGTSNVYVASATIQIAPTQSTAPGK